MAEAFSPDEWTKIRDRLAADEARFGLPRRRDGSIVLASFNIRKCGDPAKRSAGALDLMAAFIRRCDLVAVQEVMSDLSMIEELRDRAAADGAPWELLVSDVTGGVTGGRGMEERLAYLYRPDRLIRGPVVGDITYDRSSVLGNLYRHRGDFLSATVEFEDDYQAHLRAKVEKLTWKLKGSAGRKPKGRGEPRFHAPHFLTFIRTPHMATFEARSPGGGDPYRFSMVNAHLLYGGDGRRERLERENEFNALTDWMLERVASTRSHNRSYVLLGDLNLAFDKAEDKRRTRIVERIKSMNATLNAREAATVVNFPFIDPRRDPRTGEPALIRTNARQDQTFDQIAIFAKDPRLPGFEVNPGVAENPDPDGFDYQYFDFADLFAEAVLGSDTELSDMERNAKAGFIDRFQHDVSDHMPIWIRLPLPG